MEKLKKSILYTYGVGDMFFVLMVSMELYYFTAFLTDYAQFSMKTTGIILNITGVLDIACALLAGFIIEKITLKFGGKYRSWFLVGPLPIALLFILQYTKIGSEFTAATIVIIGFLSSHLLWNILIACGGAMVGRMTSSPDEHTILSTRRSQGMTAAGLIFSATGLPMIVYFSRHTNQVTGMSLTVAVYGVLMILGFLYIYKITAGMDPYDDEEIGRKSGKAEQISQKQTGPSILEIVRLVLSNRPLLGLVIAEIFRNSCILLVAGQAFYYCSYVINDLEFMTTFLLATAVAGLLGALSSTWIGLRFGKRRTYWMTLIIASIVYASAHFWGDTGWRFTILFSIGGAFMIIASCMSTALFSDTVTYGEWKTGKNIRGFTMSLWNLPIKLGVLLRHQVITLGLGAVGFVANTDPTPEVIKGIASLMIFSTSAVCFLAAVIFFFGYRIREDDVVRMQEEIAARAEYATVEK